MESGSSAYDVFLSYNRVDKPLATRIVQPLQGRGLRVWIDTSEIEPAERWIEELENGLSASRMYAVVVTRHAFKSRWVRREYYAALALNDSDPTVELVALIAEPVELPLFLRQRQYIDFRDPQTFDQSVEALARLAKSRAAPPPGEARPVAVDDEDATEEIAYLKEALRKEAAIMRSRRIVRAVATVVGIPLYLVIMAAGWAPPSVAVALGLVLFVGLVGWASTTLLINASEGRTRRIQFLLRKFQQCSERADVSCAELKPEFWRIVHE